MEVTTERLENAGKEQQRPKTVTHKCWKSRLHLLLKHPSDAKFSRKKSASKIQGESDQSLEKILTHQSAVAAFQSFCKSEFCEENIEFWLVCEDFRKTKTTEKLAVKANEIYEEFIRKGSPKEVNLDFHSRECISQCLQQPTVHCFEEAQKRIYYLMENNSYPRFLQSDFYHSLSNPKRLQKPIKPRW